MTEKPVRGHDRGGLLFYLMFCATVFAFAIFGAIGLLLSLLRSDPAWGAAATISYLVLMAIIAASAAITARLLLRRYWVEVDTTGLVTIRTPVSTTKVAICPQCRLDTDSFVGRRLPRIRCRRQAWYLRPMNPSPWFMGGRGPNYDQVLMAIQAHIDRVSKQDDEA